MHSATKGLDWELEVRALSTQNIQSGGVMRRGCRVLYGCFKVRVLPDYKKKKVNKVSKRLGSYPYLPYL